MPQDADKYKGRGKQATGKMKETAGKVTGNRRTEASGKAQQSSLALLQSNAMQPSLFAKPVESITMPEAGPDFCVRGARQKGLASQ